MSLITPVDDSIKEWNIFFSRDILINVPHNLQISFNCPPNTQLLYKGTVYLDPSRSEQELNDLRNILQTGHQLIASDNQKITLYNIDTTNTRTESCKIGKVEILNQLCEMSPLNGDKSVLTITLKILMTVPFMKFDMVCVFATKDQRLVCVPMKGLTSFVLEINDKEIVPERDGGILERKITKSQKGSIQSSGQKVMICSLKGTQQLFEKQIKIHQSLRCSQISSFVYAVPSKSMLIFECPKKWTLKQYLLDNNGKSQLPISRSLLIKFCLDISKAMNYLQVSQIVHRDLSAESVFVFSTDPHDYVNCKLGDVCCCERVSEKGFESGMTRPIYNNHAENFRMPPEISSKESAYTSQCDIYSFGILMFHILTGYLNTNPIGESGNISPMYTRQIPHTFVNIIDSCCAMNANERPKFSVVVERIKTIFTTEMKDENKVVKKKELLKYPLV